MMQGAVPAERPYGRRADAERNREAVLDHAARLLSIDPAAGMAEIAAQSRIGRATLYRHFPTREVLIDAILTRALDDVERAIAASRLDEGAASEALTRLIAALFEVSDRYRFLFVQETLQPDRARRCDIEARFEQPILALFERGRSSGEFPSELSAVALSAVFGGAMVMVLHEVAGGRLQPAEGEAAVVSTLLDGWRRQR
jgi:AcrR family transcriptional regulator